MGKWKDEPVHPVSPYLSLSLTAKRANSSAYKCDKLSTWITWSRFRGGGGGPETSSIVAHTPGPGIHPIIPKTYPAKVKPPSTISYSSSSPNSSFRFGCFGLGTMSVFNGIRSRPNTVPGDRFAEKNAYMKMVQNLQMEEEAKFRRSEGAPWITGISQGRVQKLTQPLPPSYRSCSAFPTLAKRDYTKIPFPKSKPQEIQTFSPNAALQKTQESHEQVQKLFKEFDSSLVEEKLDDEITVLTATTPTPNIYSMKSVLDRKATPHPKAGINLNTGTGREIRLFSPHEGRSNAWQSYRTSFTPGSENSIPVSHSHFNRLSGGIGLRSNQTRQATETEPEIISLSSNSSESDQVKEIKTSSSRSSSSSSWISHFSEGVKISEKKLFERKDGSSDSDDDLKIVSEKIVSPANRRNITNSFELEACQSPYFKKSWLAEGTTRYKADQKRRQDEIDQHLKTMQILRTESDLSQSRDKRIRDNLTNYEIIVLVEEPAKYPPITDEMQMHIDRALKYGNPNEVLATAFNIQITRGDLKTLVPCQWLNDNVINTYMDMIAESSRLQKQNGGSLPSVHVFTTFFYPKFLKEGYSNVLKRWTRKVDIFSFDLLLFPIHLGIHWCLATADLRTKTIRYYDSLLGRQTTCVNALLNYLAFEMRERKKVELNRDDWELELVRDIPTQENGSDCGVFICKFAQYLSRDAPFTFGQEQMNYFRHRMIYEIMNHDLLFP